MVYSKIRSCVPYLLSCMNDLILLLLLKKRWTYLMGIKLILTIEESVIANAKQYARQKQTSLSSMVENYSKIVATQSVCAENELTPVVKSLKGSFKAPADFNYKVEL